MSRMRCMVTIAALGFLLQTAFGSEALAEGPAEPGPSPMVTICHKPGTPAEKTMAVNLNALQGHLAHGDLEGPCIRSLIDAHGQFDHEVAKKTVIDLLNQGGISSVILMARKDRPPEDAADLADLFPGRIIPAVKTKDNLPDKPYDEFIGEQVDSGRFQAMGEVLMYHAQKGNRAPKFVRHLNSNRVQIPLNFSLDKNWPFIVHIEFRAAYRDTTDPSLDPQFLTMGDQFMAELKQLLKQYPNHPFVLIHMGQLKHDAVRALIDAYDNVYFMTSNTNPVLAGEGQPWVMIFDGKRLAKEWEQLFIDHPDRFILAFDNVFPEHWNEPDRYLDQIAFWRKALKWLPLDVAEAVAHGNAERLWNLLPVE